MSSPVPGRRGARTARQNAAAGREPSAAPPQHRLQVNLGTSIVLHPRLAACVLHELVKFLFYTRGQANTPFEQLRGKVEAALAELTDGAAGGQVPQGPSGGAAAGTETDQEAAAAEGAAARGTCADGDQSMGQRQQQVPPQRLQPSLRRRRRVRLPSHIKRLTKFVGSMDTLLSSLSPQLLASALPSHVALTFGPSPARPREVYCITFNPPLAAAPVVAAAAGAGGGSAPPPAQQRTPLPPQPSHGDCSTTQLPQRCPHQQGVVGGLGGGGVPAAQAVQGPAAGGGALVAPSTPRGAPAVLEATAAAAALEATAAAAALQLGPDPCAAAAAALTDREWSALRRAMRGVVVSQEQVPAWEKLLRPTSMFLAMTPGRSGWAPQAAAAAAVSNGCGIGSGAAGGAGGGLGARRGRLGVPVFKAAQRLVLGMGPPAAGGGRAAGRAVRRALQVHLEVLSSGATHTPPADAHPPTSVPAGTAAAATPTPTAPPGAALAATCTPTSASTASPAALASLQLATSQLRLSTTPAPRDHQMPDQRPWPLGAGDAGYGGFGQGVAGTGDTHNSGSCCWYVCSAHVRSVVKPEEQEQG